MRSDMWARGLAWWNIHFWFSHNSALFLYAASLKHTKTFCLPSDHTVQIHSGQCLCSQKTQPTPSLINLSMFFFGQGDLPHPLGKLHLGFNIIAGYISFPVIMFLRKFQFILSPKLLTCDLFFTVIIVTGGQQMTKYHCWHIHLLSLVLNYWDAFSIVPHFNFVGLPVIKVSQHFLTGTSVTINGVLCN